MPLPWESILGATEAIVDETEKLGGNRHEGSNMVAERQCLKPSAIRRHLLPLLPFYHIKIKNRDRIFFHGMVCLLGETTPTQIVFQTCPMQRETTPSPQSPRNSCPP
jgi:hypothetical protein